MRARVLLLTAAVLFSTSGAAVKACSLSAWQISAFRAAIAAVSLVVLLPTARRSWSRRTVMTGLAGAATMMLFVAATKRTTAASAIFLQATAPLWVFGLSPHLIGEPRRPRDVPIMVVIGLGLLGLVFGVDAPMASAPDPMHGNLLAATSGLTWGLAILGLRSSASDAGGGDSALVAANVFAAVIAMPLALPVIAASTTDWLVILYLGVIQVGFGYACFARGLRGVTALEASLLMLVEPVLNPLWAWWIQGERVGSATMIGAAVILAALAARSILETRAAPATAR